MAGGRSMKVHCILPRHLMPENPAPEDGMLVPPDPLNWSQDFQLFAVILKPGAEDGGGVREPPIEVERIPCPNCRGDIASLFCSMCSPAELGLRGWVYRILE